MLNMMLWAPAHILYPNSAAVTNIKRPIGILDIAGVDRVTRTFSSFLELSLAVILCEIFRSPYEEI